MTPLTPDEIERVTAAYTEHKTIRATAAALGMSFGAVHLRLARAAERGMLAPGSETMPGYAIRQLTRKDADGTIIQERKEAGEQYEPLGGMALKGRTTWVNGEDRVTNRVYMERADTQAALAAMSAAVAAFKEDVPRTDPVAPPAHTHRDLLNQYTITDAHFGMLAWLEEAGADYDLNIAERLLLDWFAAAIDMAPDASTAILAQLGDLMHYDGFESKTPTSGHFLDADSRLPKVIRVVIRTLRRIVSMLLAKHDHVHIIMADANHDPASEAWLREMFAAFYEDEPRVTVDSTAGTYYAYEHGDVSLFYHHGHKRKVETVDSVFAGKYREIYGRTTYSYAHLGHLHSDALKSTNLMKVERHETLAAADAYVANGGWLSGRSAKVITYHRAHGEVARLTLSPDMVSGRHIAANDNLERRAVA